MDAKAYAARNRQGSDWFSHTAEKAAPSPAPAPIKSAHVPAEASHEADRTQLIRPVCTSNQWYKYEEGQTGSTAARSHDASNDVAAGMASKPSSGWQPGASSPAVVEHGKTTKEDAEAYGKRDKAGSDWFSHGNEQQHGGQATPRCATAEGTSNANRMRQQSEDWFGHSGTQETNQTGRMKSANRNNQGAMHDIFHMNGDK